MRITRTPRRGLTLVELMVAAALSLVIMTVLASAFQTGMDTLSQLKSVGELQERLRSTSEKMKADLVAPHFNDPAVAGGKLSNVRFDIGGAIPSAGMFRIVQAGATYQEVFPTSNPLNYSTIASPARKTPIPYPSNPYNLPIRPAGAPGYPASGGNTNAMQFAVKLDGKTRQNVFTAPRPATFPGTAFDNVFDNLVVSPTTTYATRWAVISYFLADSGTKTGSGAPLYNLYRRVQLLAEQPGAVLVTPDVNYSLRPVSAPSVPGGFVYAVNTVADLTAISNRPGTAPVGFPAPYLNSPAFNAFMPLGDGSDVAMSNVVSFEIKMNWDSPANPTNPSKPLFNKLTPTPAAGPSGGVGDVPNADYPFDDLPVVMPSPTTGIGPINPNTSSAAENSPRIFDTSGSPTSSEGMLGIPVTYDAPVRINAIQIKLRVWDPKNRGARQMTVVQDM